MYHFIIKKVDEEDKINGLPQGSVLIQIVFNIIYYTNDQPIGNRKKRFIYADDLAVITQNKLFEEDEGTGKPHLIILYEGILR